MNYKIQEGDVIGEVWADNDNANTPEAVLIKKADWDGIVAKAKILYDETESLTVPITEACIDVTVSVLLGELEESDTELDVESDRWNYTEDCLVFEFNRKDKIVEVYFDVADTDWQNGYCRQYINFPVINVEE